MASTFLLMDHVGRAKSELTLTLYSRNVLIVEKHVQLALMATSVRRVIVDLVLEKHYVLNVLLTSTSLLIPVLNVELSAKNVIQVLTSAFCAGKILF